MHKLVAIFLFAATVQAQTKSPDFRRMHWHMGNYQKISSNRFLVSYYNEGGDIMVCNEAHVDGYQSIGEATSCVILPAAPSTITLPKP